MPVTLKNKNNKPSDLENKIDKENDDSNQEDKESNLEILNNLLFLSSTDK